MRWPGIFRKPLTAVATLLLAASGAVAVTTATATPAAAASASITVNGTQGGRTFDGIGAISGGGGNSKLFADYPATQQQQIDDYLFKPGYGASLQILKVEIGGDTNSTDGSESSIEHSRGAVNCNVGYEWPMMEAAKARNPNIKLYGLAWGAPGWIGSGNFWSTDMINYLVSWLNCAKSDGLTINYLGGWNERGYNISWYEQLRSTLNADGYSGVQLVADDTSWNVANDLVSNSAFSQAVQIVGSHYPCGWMTAQTSCPSSSNAVATGKPLFASENGSQDYNNGAAAMARADNRDYLDGKMTATINWPVVASIYPAFPYATDGLILANQPSSGWYSVGKQAWVTAQTTQFTAPGWTYIDSASGYIGGSGNNGSYVTLKSPDGTDWSSIIETTQASAAQTASYTITGGLSTGTVHVWTTNVNSSRPLHLVRALAGHHPGRRQLLPDAAARLRVLADHDHRAGQGHRHLPRPGVACPAVLRQLRLRHRRPAAAVPVADAGRVRGRAVRGRPVRAVRTAAGPGQAHRMGRQRQPVHDRRLAGLVQLHRVRGRADRAGRRGAAHRAGRLLGRLQPARGQRVLPAAVQHRRLAGGARNGRRGYVHAGQRHRVRAGHGHLAAPGADLQRRLDQRGDQRHHRDDRHRLHLCLGLRRLRHVRLPDRPVRQPVGHPGRVDAAGRPGRSRRGVNSAKCVDDNGQSSANGTKIQVWDCNGGANQSWTVASNGTVQVFGKCLDITGASTANGALIELWQCNGGANQQWQASNGALVNPVSGKCLDDPGSNTANGTQLDLWTCTGGANQQWHLP